MLPEIGIALVAGLALGFLLAWALGRSRQRVKSQRAAQLEQQLTERSAALDALQRKQETTEVSLRSFEKENARLEERLTAEKASLEQARNSLSDTFGALARKALSENSQSFLDFAKQELGKQQQTASTSLEAKEVAIANLLKPVGEALEKLQTATQGMEKQRAEAYGAVLTEIKNIQETHQSLRRETSQLVQALRAPKARGNWGELQLKRCVEFAGMVEHASFDKEVFVRGEDGSIRPDCVIHLPNERTIIIDAKTPFDAYLDATICTDEVQRTAFLAAHAARVREHLSQLSAKAYWKQFKESPDFVVCFLSSEVLFSAALEQDPGLIEFGSNSNVILATPTTLIALLKAVAYGWQQMEITRNAIAIQEAGKKLYEKLATAQSHFSKLGNALEGVVGHYNNLIGCVEGRDSIFDRARELHQLGIGKGELEELKTLDSEKSKPRLLKGKDWAEPVFSDVLSELAASAEEN